jgi:uncharacterized protein (TIGR03067 family)
MRLQWLGLVSAFALVVSTSAAQDKGGTGDKDKLQGTWSVVSATKGGKAMPADQTKGVTVTFKADKMIIAMQGKDDKMEATFTVNASKKPKEMDVDFGKDPKGKEMKGTGIYELDGDNLKIAHGEFGDPRPKDFESKDGSNVSVMVLKREKK